MARAGAWATLAAGAALTLGGCKSFHYKVGTPDPRPIHSVFLIVDKRENLKHENTDQIMDLVRPEKYGDYPFFAQFLPGADKTWQQVDCRGSLEPKIKGDHISLKVSPNFIKVHEGALVAVVVRFQDRTWKCKTDPLVLKGSCEYEIGSSDLIAKR